MNKPFWDDDTFSENPVQFTGGKGDAGWSEKETFAPVPETELRKPRQPVPIKTEEEQIEEIVEELDLQEDEDDFTEVLSDARLRLEQGRLYEMVMQHELFNGLDADPRAVKSVQSQIRRFAKERMEIMLGIKTETTKTERLEIDFPFNSLEVSTLKKLASAATKGASEEDSDKYVPEVKRITEEVPAVPKKQTLNSIGPSKAKAQVKPQVKPKLENKPLKKAEPIKRQPKSNLPKEFEMDYEPLENHPSVMAKDDLVQRNAEAAQRQQGKKAVAPQHEKKPWPTYEETEMIALQQAQKAVSGFNSKLSNSLKSVIANAVKK